MKDKKFKFYEITDFQMNKILGSMAGLDNKS